MLVLIKLWSHVTQSLPCSNTFVIAWAMKVLF